MEYESYVNHIKLFYIVMKMGGDVFVQTLKTLYKGPHPITSHLVDLADAKSSNINKDEKGLLENIKSKERDLKTLDITLSYKLIQLSCGLKPRQTSFANSCVWSQRCPSDRKDSLEHLLFRYKTERNKIVHQFSSSGAITDVVFRTLKEENIQLLKLIIEAVGKEAKLSNQEIKIRKNRIEIECDSFCQQLGMGGRNLSSHSDIEEEIPKLEKPRRKKKADKKKGRNEKEKQVVNDEDESRSIEEEEVEEYGLDYEEKSMKTKSNQKTSFLNKLSCFSGSESGLSGRPSSSSSATPIDYSPVITKTILTAFGKDFEAEEQVKPYEKSNRVFWVNKLVAGDVLQDQRKLKNFWKEYEKSSS